MRGLGLPTHSWSVVRVLKGAVLGVDVDFFHPAPQRVPLPGGWSFNFAAIAAFISRKNVEFTVRAFL